MRPEKVGTNATSSANEAEKTGLFRALGSTFLFLNTDLMFVISFPVLFFIFNIVYWFSLI